MCNKYTSKTVVPKKPKNGYYSKLNRFESNSMLMPTSGTEPRYRPTSLSICLRCTVPTQTHPDELHQCVVDEGSFGQEEATPGAQVVEEEEVLLLHREHTQDTRSPSQLHCCSHFHPSISTSTCTGECDEAV